MSGPPPDSGETTDAALSPTPDASVVSTVTASTFAGPLPPPAALREYDEVIADGAERIMRMAETSLKHRQKLDRERLDLDRQRLDAEREEARAIRSERFRGQIGGFLLGVIPLGLAAWLINRGHSWPGAILGIGGITSLVGTYMYGYRRERRPDQQEGRESRPATREDEGAG